MTRTGAILRFAATTTLLGSVAPGEPITAAIFVRLFVVFATLGRRQVVRMMPLATRAGDRPVLSFCLGNRERESHETPASEEGADEDVFRG